MMMNIKIKVKIKLNLQNLFLIYAKKGTYCWKLQMVQFGSNN